MSWVRGQKGWLKGYVRERDRPVKDPEPINDIEPVVTIKLARCPQKECRSKDVSCYKSIPPIRYQKCNVCGFKFKSHEIE